MQSVAQKITALATLANAREYERLVDKYLFAKSLIESELNIYANQLRVNYLERCFDAVLAEANKQETEEKAIMQNMDQNKTYPYVFSPISGERLTLGYCIKLIEKQRHEALSKAEKLDLELAIAWHNALSEAMYGEK